MKSPFAKLAAAAAVVIVCATGLSLWKTTGAGIALADVLARVEQIKALRYNLTVTMTYPESDPNIAGPDLQFIYTTWAADEYGWKEIGRYADPNGDGIDIPGTLLPAAEEAIRSHQPGTEDLSAPRTR